MSNTTRQGTADPAAVMPIEASRRGAHRARPNPWFGVLPAVAVAVVVAAVAVLTYTLFGHGDSPSSSTAAGSSTPTAAATVAGGGTAGSAATPTPAATAGQVNPAPAPTPSVGAVASSPPAATGGVDTTVTLRFFNGTRPNVQGVSRLAAEKFTALGWKVGPYAAWTGPAVTQTTIYYGKADQKPTAQTIAATLGVGTVKLSAARAGKGIVIVVSNDYKP